MTYTPTVWKDRVVENPHQYKDQFNNVLILTRDAGVVTEEGTEVTAGRMNNIETGISDVQSLAEGKVSSVSSTSPIVSSGGLTPIISIQEANATQDGFMTMEYAMKLDKQICSILLSNLVVANTTFVDITGFSIPVTAGKIYRIEMIGNYSTTAGGNGTKLGMYLPSGAGTIVGQFTIGKSATADVAFFKLPMIAIGASGLTGSFVTGTSAPPTGGERGVIGINAVFKCTSTGELRVQFASEVVGNATLYADASLISSEY